MPACGPGLDFMLETLPMTQVLEKVFKGSGECAQIDWTFLGQSMPFWVGAFLLLTLLLALYNGWRQTR
ncbi:disulfide bond formation protein B [compost metagenome]